MDLDDLNKWLMLAANFGVIAGIAFLVFEIRQNNELLELQGQIENRSRTTALVELVVNNPDLTELLAKEESELSLIERNRLIALGIRALINFEDLYRDMIDGRVSEEDAIRRLRSVWSREELNYAVPLAWDSFKVRMPQDFIDWMESNIIH